MTILRSLLLVATVAGSALFATSARADHFDRRYDRTAPMQVKLGQILARAACGAGKPQHQCTIQDPAPRSSQDLEAGAARSWPPARQEVKHLACMRSTDSDHCYGCWRCTAR